MKNKANNIFFRKLRQQIFQYQLYLPGDRWLLAVSGGPDSMAMLYGVVKLRETTLIDLKYLHVAHLNHQLRAEESDADAEFVRKQARLLGLPVTISSENVAETSQQTNESVETAARNSRYRFLAETALEHNCNKIVLGHNADDNIETILHRIIRGTGIRGLAGIPSVRALSTYKETAGLPEDKEDAFNKGKDDTIAEPAEKKIFLIRPLLSLRRLEIENFLGKQKIECRLDRSNLCSDYTRNRIRNSLLPLLEKQYNPRITDSLTRLGHIAEQFRENLAEQTEEMRRNLIVSPINENHIIVDGESLANLNEFQQMELVHQVLQVLKVPLRRMGYKQFRSILNIIQRKDQARSTVNLPEGLKVMRQSKNVIFQKGVTEDISVYSGEQYLTPFPGETILDQPWWLINPVETEPVGISSVKTEMMAEGEQFLDKFRQNKHPFEEVIDRDRLRGNLYIRGRRDGDRFQALGSAGEKKLGDFFTDQKIPVYLRNQTGLLCDQEGIIWVMGLRISERVKITSTTKSLLKLTLQ